MMNEDIAIYI